MTGTEQLMQGTLGEDEKYSEEWKIIMNTKGEYTLGKLQARIIMRAMSEGKREVMFQTFMIAIPYMAEFYRVRRFLKDTVKLSARASEKLYKPMSKEKWAKFKKLAYSKIGKRVN